MDKEKQRITIAEACGWVRHGDEGIRGCWDCPMGYTHSDCPDYLNDLNAMHEAEKVLVRNDSAYSVGSMKLYLHYLSVVTDEQHPIDATAAQRAEAFLLTIEKWEE